MKLANWTSHRLGDAHKAHILQIFVPLIYKELLQLSNTIKLFKCEQRIVNTFTRRRYGTNKHTKKMMHSISH